MLAFYAITESSLLLVKHVQISSFVASVSEFLPLLLGQVSQLKD